MQKYVHESLNTMMKNRGNEHTIINSSIITLFVSLTNQQSKSKENVNNDMLHHFPPSIFSFTHKCIGL